MIHKIIAQFSIFKKAAGAAQFNGCMSRTRHGDVCDKVVAALEMEIQSTQDGVQPVLKVEKCEHNDTASSATLSSRPRHKATACMPVRRLTTYQQMRLKILDNSGTDARGSLPRMTHSFCNSRSVWQFPLRQPGNEVLRQTDAHLSPPGASVH